MRLIAASLILLSATACTWVPIEPAGKAVSVIGAGAAPAGCTARGEIVVSVKDKVGFYERNALRVQEELETLARNEASSVQANTVQPLSAPAGGEQRFAAWQCARR